MTELTVGTIVKSYDFPGRTDCYMIGMVVSVDESYGGFKAKTLKIVREDIAKEIVMARNDYFTASFNGNSMFDDMFPNFERVVVVG